MHLVTARQMAAIDRRTISGHGIPGIELMHRAGAAVVDEILDRSGSLAGDRVVVLCGRGNNGGDGFIVARLLRERNADVAAYLIAEEPDRMTGDARLACHEWRAAGGEVIALSTDDAVHAAAREWAESDMVVDGLLGTGLAGEVRGVVRTAIEEVGRLRVPIIAIDIPSGVSGDTGEILGAAITASLTVTFGLPKVGQALHPGKRRCGTLAVADIGFPPEVVAAEAGTTFLTGRSDARGWIPRREPDTHKGAVGRILVVAGSVGFTGAAALSSEAAFRAGAGLVFLACPASVNDILEGCVREVITYPVPEVRAKRCLSLRAHGEIRRRIEEVDVVAIGPGLGRHRETVELVRRLVAEIDRPLVVDADGLFALSPLVRAEGAPAVFADPARVVLTPHRGEFARLRGMDVPAVERDTVGLCRQAAADWGVTVLLKGEPTIVAGPSGETWLNPTGNPGMATGGTGDVLTGVIAGFIGQGVAPEIAARLGAFVHGHAGDRARDELGEHGMIAGDVLRHIPGAIRDILS